MPGARQETNLQRKSNEAKTQRDVDTNGHVALEGEGDNKEKGWGWKGGLERGRGRIRQRQ